MHPLDALLQLYARLTLDAQHFGTISLDLTQRYDLYGFGLLLDLSLELCASSFHLYVSTNQDDPDFGFGSAHRECCVEYWLSCR